MRCYICNKAIETPNYNSDHEDYEPCDECQAVIRDTLEGYLDQPTAPEEFGGPDVVLLYYPPEENDDPDDFT